jgi:hypothetical protein
VNPNDYEHDRDREVYNWIQDALTDSMAEKNPAMPHGAGWQNAIRLERIHTALSSRFAIQIPAHARDLRQPRRWPNRTGDARVKKLGFAFFKNLLQSRTELRRAVGRRICQWSYSVTIPNSGRTTGAVTEVFLGSQNN